LEGHEIVDVASVLHVSRREHNRRHDALEALLPVLRIRCGMPSPFPRQHNQWRRPRRSRHS
jgi:hypothetical protein